MAQFINIEKFSEEVRKALDEAKVDSTNVAVWDVFLDSLESYAKDNSGNPLLSREINHGEWTDGEVAGYNFFDCVCPFCYHIEYAAKKPNFCPNCGADMRPHKMLIAATEAATTEAATTEAAATEAPE